MSRDWLARRIETEARAYANADSTTRDIRWGRVLGFLEVGTHAGYWSPKVAAQVADSIQQKWGLRRIRRRLTSARVPDQPGGAGIPAEGRTNV